ncbi:LacI family DNA-binding transcriptional regulator [Levilactobacillus brevis]|uniref:LacI family DNA-binding transcriptional regulator n=1 Tax=Levilactobacillus brevis TaxID=1580 RepID=UPI0039E5D37F
MTTIRDVARLAGYSPATESRVLNQSGYVSSAAQAKIRAIIQQLDYVPNDIARDLSHGRTKNIGVVMPNMGHPYFTEITNGILRAAFAAEDRVVMLSSKYDPQLEKQYLEQLHRKSFDALIFISHALPLAQLAQYQSYGAVVCCEDPQAISLSAAFSVREPAYLAAFNWIKQHHYQQIAVLLSRSTTVSATSRLTLEVFQHVFDRKPNPNGLVMGITTFDDGYAAAKQLVQHYQQVDFIFANSDDIAAGVRQFYLDHQLEVPSMMGQENQLAGQLLKLPTIDHHLSAIGQTAFELATSDQVEQIGIPADFILR